MKLGYDEVAFELAAIDYKMNLDKRAIGKMRRRYAN
jgi:hypothetical protein